MPLDRCTPRQARSRTAEGHVECQSIAGNHLSSKLGVVDATQRDPRRRRAILALEDEDGGDLRQRLDHQDRRHDRHAGKVSLEEFFVDGDILERHEPVAALVLPDGVDQK